MIIEHPGHCLPGYVRLRRNFSYPDGRAPGIAGLIHTTSVTVGIAHCASLFPRHRHFWTLESRWIRFHVHGELY